MRRIAFFPIAALLLAACSRQPLPPTAMELTSPAFEANGAIPVQYTCDGGRVSPPLTFSAVPEGTESLALIVDDPDAPSGDWVHWIVYGIGPTVSMVAEGTVPDGGMEGVNSSGDPAYGAPCPPSGTHRYVFRLYALDADPDLPELPGRAALLRAMEGHILSQAELVGLYERSR